VCSGAMRGILSCRPSTEHGHVQHNEQYCHGRSRDDPGTWRPLMPDSDQSGLDEGEEERRWFEALYGRQLLKRIRMVHVIWVFDDVRGSILR
jgi:hypothetical protein